MYRCPNCMSEMEETKEGSCYHCLEPSCDKYFNIIELNCNYEIKS